MIVLVIISDQGMDGYRYECIIGVYSTKFIGFHYAGSMKTCEWLNKHLYTWYAHVYDTPYS